MGERPAAPLVRFWRWFVVAPLRQAEAESRALTAAEADAAGHKALIVLLTAALLLTLQFYFCRIDALPRTRDGLQPLPGGAALDDYVQGLGPPQSAAGDLPWLCHWAL